MIKRITIINNGCYRAKKSIYTKSMIGRIKKDIGPDIVFTEYPGHADTIVRKSSSYDTIIVAGGDGTISEVVNSMNLETQVLAVIPIGTGNSLARNLRINSMVKAFETIKKNLIDHIDLIYCQFETDGKKFERYNVATSGLGFAAATAAFANRYLKIAGPLCYPLSACFKSFNQEVLSARIQIDSSFKDIKFTNFLINNTKYAGNSCVFPMADLKDSAFNILYTKTNALTQYLWNIAITTKTYFYYPGVMAVDKLHIVLQKPSPFMMDGEIYNSIKQIRYSIAPRKLKVLT